MHSHINTDTKYMVFKLSKEEQSLSKINNSMFWGWTKSKAVIQAFKAQRNMKKYVIMKMDPEDMEKYFLEDMTDSETMIDYVELGDVISGKDVTFFTTKTELREAKKRIERLMREASSFETLPGNITDYVNILVNLKDRFADALDVIGFDPPELAALDNWSDQYDDAAYISSLDSCGVGHRWVKDTPRPIERVIYSLQSIIKVLRDDL